MVAVLAVLLHPASKKNRATTTNFVVVDWKSRSFIFFKVMSIFQVSWFSVTCPYSAALDRQSALAGISHLTLKDIMPDQIAKKEINIHTFFEDISKKLSQDIKLSLSEKYLVEYVKMSCLVRNSGKKLSNSTLKGIKGKVKQSGSQRKKTVDQLSSCLPNVFWRDLDIAVKGILKEYESLDPMGSRLLREIFGEMWDKISNQNDIATARRKESEKPKYQKVEADESIESSHSPTLFVKREETGSFGAKQSNDGCGLNAKGINPESNFMGSLKNIQKVISDIQEDHDLNHYSWKDAVTVWQQKIGIEIADPQLVSTLINLGNSDKKELQTILNEGMSLIQLVLLEEVNENNYIEGTEISRDTCVQSANNIANQESRSTLIKYLATARGITQNRLVKEGLEGILDILILVDADYKLKAQSTISSSRSFSSLDADENESINDHVRANSL